VNRQSVDAVRQSKNHVEIRNRQEFRASSFYPILSFITLTLGTMPIATRVVANTQITTAIASIDMTTQRGRSAFSDGIKRTKLPSIEPITLDF
jgi:hypothetical protein